MSSPRLICKAATPDVACRRVSHTTSYDWSVLIAQVLTLMPAGDCGVMSHWQRAQLSASRTIPIDILEEAAIRCRGLLRPDDTRERAEYQMSEESTGTCGRELAGLRHRTC